MRTAMGGLPLSPEDQSDVPYLDPAPLATSIDPTVQSPTVPDRRTDSATSRIIDVDLQHLLEQFPSETELETLIPVTHSLVEQTASISIDIDFELEEIPSEHKQWIVVPAGPPVRLDPPTRDGRATAAVVLDPAAFGRSDASGHFLGRFGSRAWAPLQLLRTLFSSARLDTIASGDEIRTALRQLAIQITQRAGRFFNAGREGFRSARAAFTPAVSWSVRRAFDVAQAVYFASRRSVTARRTWLRSAMSRLTWWGVRAVRSTARLSIDIGQELKSTAQWTISQVDHSYKSALALTTLAARALRLTLSERAYRTTRVLQRTRRRWGFGLANPFTIAAHRWLPPTLIIASLIATHIVLITWWNGPTGVQSVEPHPPGSASPSPTVDTASFARTEAPTDKAVRRDAPIRAVAPRPTQQPRPVDSALIRRVLSRYRDAYSILSVSGVRAVWPSVDAIALRNTFDGLAEQNFEYDSCRISADETGALALCSGVAEFRRVGARTTTTERRQWHFTLHKVDTTWLISTVASR
jgi:hypothetical protein